MLRQERVSQIVDMVLTRGSLSVEDIVSAMGISPATARRDIDYLAQQQLVTRTRGGVMANTTSGELPLRYRPANQSEAKLRIAQAAADLINPGDIIGFNGGTTTTQVAHEIGVRTDASLHFDEHPLTLVTNAVNIANDVMVRRHISVVVLGGVSLTRSYELIGPLSHLMLPHIAIDTLFLGVNAIDPERGFFCMSEGEADINAALVRLAKRTVVVADSDKCNQTAFANICALGDVHMVISDTDLCPEVVSALETAGVACRLV